MYSTKMKEDAHLDESVSDLDGGDSIEHEFLGMFCQTAKQSRIMLFATAVVLDLSTTAVSAGEKPTPHELGEYIGWLVSCGAIQGNQDEVGRALRRSIERNNPWDYSESDITGLVKSVQFGAMGRLKWDNGEQICAEITGNKQSVEWAKQLIELDRYEPAGKSAKTPTLRDKPDNDLCQSLAYGNPVFAKEAVRRGLTEKKCKEILGEAQSADLTEARNRAQALYQQGLYHEAERFARKALKLNEREFGPDHPTTANRLNNLAILLRLQGRYGGAESLHKRAQAIYENKLAPDHTFIATSLGEMAELYRLQGRYAEAEPLYKRALAIKEKAHGPEHPSVASILNNLANLYRAQGRYAEAEPLQKRDLAISEKALGPNHSDIGVTLDNLGVLYRLQSRYVEAEPLHKRALAIYEKALGPEHLFVAFSLENYAVLLRETGRTAEADKMEARAKAIRVKRAKEKP